MVNYLTSLLLLFLLAGCGNPTKNTEAEVLVEAGTDIATVIPPAPEPPSFPSAESANLLGFWVGYFNPDREKTGYEKSLYVDEGYVWERRNKINISLDRIAGDSVVGHSVVAGNDRPFTGTVESLADGGYHFQVEEPGDDRYDGAFAFTIRDGKLTGTWEAYGTIDIRHRKYELDPVDFRYDPDVALSFSKRYVDWEKKVGEMDEELGEELLEFSSATSKIYEINASNTSLTQEVIENLHRGDLLVIRNTIYARHGYSFKHRPLRVFFDAQDWYVPVHTDIRADFTDVEKADIRLLLRYEKNAAEYYDSFGRG